MVKRFSALETNYKIGFHGKDTEPKLFLKEVKNLSLYQVAAWPSTIDQVGEKLQNILGLTSYPNFNKVLINDTKAMLRTEPLKFWVLGEDKILISSDEGAFLDLSHAFTCIEVQGGLSKVFLNRHLPLDLRDNFFLINSIVSSAIHHVSVKLWRTTDGYKLFIPRGFALSIWEILLQSASQFGYEIL